MKKIMDGTNECGTWAWQQLGKGMLLVAQNDKREIILGAADIRDPRSTVPNPVLVMGIEGELVAIDPDHPNAKLLADAPRMKALLLKINGELNKANIFSDLQQEIRELVG